MAALVAVIGFAAPTSPTSAQVFLSGQSKGMNKCVRAILPGYKVKRVNVHGHHFNCHPLKRWDADSRIIELDRNLRFADDNTYFAFFDVNRAGSREFIETGSLRTKVLKGATIGQITKILRLPARFIGPPGRMCSRTGDCACFVDFARQVGPRERKNWEFVAQQITAIVIAELGEPWP